MTWPEKTAKAFTDLVMLSAHGTYNALRGRRMIRECITILERRIDEIVPKKAELKYKEARYGKKEKEKKGRC